MTQKNSKGSIRGSKRNSKRLLPSFDTESHKTLKPYYEKKKIETNEAQFMATPPACHTRESERASKRERERGTRLRAAWSEPSSAAEIRHHQSLRSRPHSAIFSSAPTNSYTPARSLKKRYRYTKTHSNTPISNANSQNAISMYF